MKIGAQLYTLRDYTQDLDSFAETLARVADMGYTAVQVSATCPFDAGWLKAQLDKNGLVCPVTHTNQDRVADETDAVAAEHKIFGAKIVGLGSAPGIFEPETFSYESFRDRFVPVANRLKEQGLLLGYHNHHPEFGRTDGVSIFERIIADFPVDALTFILDTYWIQYAGGDPAEWIRKLIGRVHCVHFKDMSIVGKEQRMASIGEGNINFGACISACEDAGTEYAFVELDNCYGEDPFGCLERSYKYLKSKGLS